MLRWPGAPITETAIFQGTIARPKLSLSHPHSLMQIALPLRHVRMQAARTTALGKLIEDTRSSTFKMENTAELAMCSTEPVLACSIEVNVRPSGSSPKCRVVAIVASVIGGDVLHKKKVG